jgi:hypothetical protein
MSPREFLALRDYLGPELLGRTISGARTTISLTGILSQSCLGGRGPEPSGRAVLLGLSGQLLSALAMIELDGSARECRASLAPHKVPATIRFIGELDVTPAGKLARADA